MVEMVGVSMIGLLFDTIIECVINWSNLSEIKSLGVILLPDKIGADGGTIGKLDVDK